ncbi:MAG: hypothetical protein R3F19_32250 [Verrucomicrobiales bacterium]
MTDTDQQNNTVHTEQSQDRSEQSPRGFFYSLCENLDSAVKKATDRASARAGSAAPKVKKMVERGAYEVSYSAAYGIVFSAAVARQILKDNVILDGVREGIKAGREAAEKRNAAQSPQPDSTATRSTDGTDDGAASGLTPSPA